MDAIKLILLLITLRLFECKNVNNGSVMTETTTTATPNVHIFEIISDKKKASLTLKYASLWFTWIKLRGIRNLFFVNHHSHSNGFYWGRQCSLTSPQPTACASTITTATEVTRLKAMFNPTLPGNFPSGCQVSLCCPHFPLDCRCCIGVYVIMII